jgi:hypothetical protein
MDDMAFDEAAAMAALGGGGDDYDELLSPIMRASPGNGDKQSNNFSVVIRVRPPLERELHGDRPFENVVRVDAEARSIVLSENLAALESPDGGDGLAPPVAASAVGPYATHTFTFDHLYDMHADQKRVFETTAKSVVESALAGYNATIFAVRGCCFSSGPPRRERGRHRGGAAAPRRAAGRPTIPPSPPIFSPL